MKKFFLLFLVVLTGVVSSCKYDDDELWENVDDLKDRVAELETLTKRMNSDIVAMQSIITALQNQVSVSEVETLTDGYVIHFSDGTKATIKNGEKGEDGVDGENGLNAPVIGVEMYNGVYYWTLTVDGETDWLTDEAGNKLAVSGKDGSDGEDGKDGEDGEDGATGVAGVTPLLKVDADGYWLVSYDNGATYENVLDASGEKVQAVGKDGEDGQDGATGSVGAAGDSFFRKVVEKDGVLVITMKNGDVYKLALLATVTYTDAEGADVSTENIEVSSKTPIALTYNVPQLGDNYSAVVLEKNGIDIEVDKANRTLSITGNSSTSNYSPASAVILYYNANQTVVSELTFKLKWESTNESEVARVNGQYYESIDAALSANSEETDIVLELAAGEHKADLYNIAEKETLTIIGTEGTKLSFANLQVRNGLFNEIKIENCEILRMPDKKWGHLVFGGNSQTAGVYTLSNCTFNGEGSQGIYINETVSGVTYNILNCIFNGDFGSEGAITIQNNENVDHIVNVTGCTFNNIPNTSHKIFVHYAYNGWTLNTDVADSDVYWKANAN